MSAPRSRKIDPLDRVPDARDGLTRIQRVILQELHAAQQEFGERPVPSATLYGRVVQHLPLSVPEFQRVLQQLTGH